MAMRGSPPDGVRPLNRVGGVDLGGVGEERGTYAPAVLAVSRVEEPMGLVRGRPERFIRWRNNCVRTTSIIAGEALSTAIPAGFGFTPRFVERPEGGAPGFIMTLLKELASG